MNLAIRPEQKPIEVRLMDIILSVAQSNERILQIELNEDDWVELKHYADNVGMFSHASYNCYTLTGTDTIKFAGVKVVKKP